MMLGGSELPPGMTPLLPPKLLEAPWKLAMFSGGVDWERRLCSRGYDSMLL